MRHRSFLFAAVALAALMRSAAPALAEEAASAGDPAVDLRLDDSAEPAVPASPSGDAAPPGGGDSSGGKAFSADPVKVAAGEKVHNVVQGDTLWDLSARYLGSPWKWKAIWERNRFLTNPHFIYPGVKVLIIPAAAREYSMEGALPPPAPKSTAPEPVTASAPATSAAPAPEGPPVLVINPEDFVRAGEFLAARPKGIGKIKGAESSTVDFVIDDTVYLLLKKNIPAGQMLGVYRVRGPVELSAKKKGYVKYLIGILQVTDKKDEYHIAKVRKSFEELGKNSLITEEIPSYADVVVRSTPASLKATAVATRLENTELSSRDFIYLDRGSDAGVAVGDCFRLHDERHDDGSADPSGRARLPVDVGMAVVVRTSGSYSTAYIVNSDRSFQTGVKAIGMPAASIR